MDCNPPLPVPGLPGSGGGSGGGNTGGGVGPNAISVQHFRGAATSLAQAGLLGSWIDPYYADALPVLEFSVDPETVQAVLVVAQADNTEGLPVFSTRSSEPLVLPEFRPSAKQKWVTNRIILTDRNGNDSGQDPAALPAQAAQAVAEMWGDATSPTGNRQRRRWLPVAWVRSGATGSWGGGAAAGLFPSSVRGGGLIAPEWKILQNGAPVTDLTKIDPTKRLRLSYPAGGWPTTADGSPFFSGDADVFVFSTTTIDLPAWMGTDNSGGTGGGTDPGVPYKQDIKNIGLCGTTMQFHRAT